MKLRAHNNNSYGDDDADDALAYQERKKRIDNENERGNNSYNDDDTATGDRRRIFNVWKWNEYMEHNYQINSKRGYQMYLFLLLSGLHTHAHLHRANRRASMWSEIHNVTFRLTFVPRIEF